MLGSEQLASNTQVMPRTREELSILLHQQRLSYLPPLLAKCFEVWGRKQYLRMKHILEEQFVLDSCITLDGQLSPSAE